VSLALQRVEGKLQFSEPKTERSRRMLPLTDNLISLLRVHRTRQLEDKLLAVPSGKKAAWYSPARLALLLSLEILFEGSINS